MYYVIGKSVSVHRGNVKDEKSNQNQIVFTLFQLIWTQTAYDCGEEVGGMEGEGREGGLERNGEGRDVENV